MLGNLTCDHKFKLYISDKSINFQTVATYNSMFLVLFGTVCFLAQVQILHVLRYNATIAMLGTMLKECATDILAYSFISLLVFMGFVSLAYLTFWTMKDYSTFGQVNLLHNY